MANEFEFLRSRWPKLAALGADASRLVEFSPVTALSSLRDYCEWAADITLDLLGNALPPETAQEDRIAAMQAMGTVPAEILQKYDMILATRTPMAGNPLGDPNEARARMADAVDIGRWLIRQDGSARPVYAPQQPAYTQQPAAYAQEDMYATGRNAAVQQQTYDNMGYTQQVYTQGEYADRGYTDRQPTEARGRRAVDEDSSEGGINIGRLHIDTERFKQYLTLPVIISAVLVLALLIALIVILSKCGGKKPAAVTTPTATVAQTPTETYSMLITPTPTPVTTTTQPEVTEVVKYVDQFETAEITKSHTAWTNYYLGKWTANSHTASFSVFNGGSGTDAKGVLYDHGLGWFIRSADFDGSEARRALTFVTAGKYSTLTFDMGIDKEWLFEDAPDCGTYQLMVFVDDQEAPVWSSDWVNYNYYKTNIRVDVTGAQKVKIRLIQKKGSKGSLNVVLGNCGFIETAATPTAPAESTTPAVGETTPAGETTTPAGETTTTAAANP